MQQDYKSNSHRFKEGSNEPVAEKKKIEKIVSGTVKSKKKSEFQKFIGAFIPDDVPDIKSYIIMDILIPTIKKTVSDIGHNCIDAIIPGGSKYIGNKSTASKVSYRSYYDGENDKRNDRDTPSRSRTGCDCEDIIINDKGEAEEVLFVMDELIHQYGRARVADLYELVGITTRNYTSNNYGWTNLSSADAVRVRDGYLLKLPRAYPLD